MSQEIIREIGTTRPTGWSWRPVWHEDREAAQLLRRKNLTEDERESIRDDALEVLARCRAPDAEDGQETGLVVGYIQSGKTLSFTTVAALAADNGFPIIIVLSGVTKELTGQTVGRLRDDLELNRPDRPWRLLEVRPRDPELATQLRQLLRQWEGPGAPGFPRRVGLIVSLKNVERLRSLAAALGGVDLHRRPCLILDDEADQAGLNTRVGEGEFSPTYQAILNLRRVVPHHTYLQYTATPQANVLLTVLDSLHPRFGWVLRPGLGYTGGLAFFGGDHSLIRTIPDSELPSHDEAEEPPESLLDAMRLFFLGAAVRAWRQHRGLPTERLRSMLVHPSARQREHLRHKRWVDSIKERWQTLLGDGGGDPEDRAEELEAFRRAYEDLAGTAQSHAGTEQPPPFEDLIPLLASAMLDTPHAWEINTRQAEARWEQTNWSQAYSHILVGGEKLSRGFTVEGLTVTYMPRSAGQRLADTIEQRARFFGYKRGYLGLCRVFLPSDIREILAEYVEHEEFLRDKLLQLARDPSATMAEWRRAMLLTTSVKPTRPAVVPPGIYTQHDVREWTAARYPHELQDGDHRPRNRQVVDSFLARLTLQDAVEHRHQTDDQIPVRAQGIPLASLLNDLLIRFEHAARDAPHFTGLELVIQNHLRNQPDATATLYVMSPRAQLKPGGGTRDRTLTAQGDVEAFQGPDPADGSRYPGDAAVHALEEVTIQVHNIDVYRREEGRPRQRGGLLCGNMPVLAVWVPPQLRRGVLVQQQSAHV